MDKWYLSLAIIVTLLTVQASAFEGSISYSNDRFIGSTVTIQCSWVPSQDDVLAELYIGVDQIVISSNTFIYKVFLQSNLAPVKGTQFNQFNNRPQSPSVSGTSAFMNISGLQCSDERNFTCLFVYSKNGTAVINPSYTKLLDVSLRPDTPEIKQTPSDVEMQELTNLSVTCTAAFGRPGVGMFQWKVYRAGVMEIIPPGDKRIGSLVDATSQTSICSQRKEQTFSMQLTRNDQNFAVACFVTSTGYPSPEQTVCRNTTSELCQVTNTKVILYGVSADKMNITSNPDRYDFYQGERVTLTCYADGSPPPTYYWTLVEGENSTFVGNESTLVLSDLPETEGVTYNCTATNKAPAAPAITATTSRTISVSKTTTTTTTTATTPTSTVSSSSTLGGKPGDNTAAPNKGGSDDNTTTIIIVVVVVGVALIAAIIIIIICCKRRRSKGVEGQRVINRMEHEHPEKAYNNRTNPSYQGSQPDLVSDKKMQNPDMTSKSSLNGSITKEDGLMYADLTYDNRPRSRKPMAINDSSSDYSDIHVPQV